MHILNIPLSSRNGFHIFTAANGMNNALFNCHGCAFRMPGLELGELRVNQDAHVSAVEDLLHQRFQFLLGVIVDENAAAVLAVLN